MEASEVARGNLAAYFEHDLYDFFAVLLNCSFALFSWKA
jgi:hypothetical protein